MSIERHGTTRRYSDVVAHGNIVYLVEVPQSLDGDIAMQTGEVLAIEMAALTNHPAIDGMEPLALRAAATFGFIDPDSDPEEDSAMHPLLAALIAAHPALGWNVASMTAAIAALKAKGVEFLVYPGMGMEADGFWTAPDGKAKVAWFNDPDGNLLSLTES